MSDKDKDRSIRKTAKYLDDSDLEALANIEKDDNAQFQMSNAEMQFYDNLPVGQIPINSPHYIHTTMPQATPIGAYNMSPGYNYNVSLPKPFDYGKSYKIFMGNLKHRLSKEQYKEVCLHLSKIRPSFIAIAASLNEQDLNFVEHSFNRMALEYEKFMSLVGTPSAIWRRTGEIIAIGREFSFLVGWSADNLIEKYIFDIMTPQSVVNYFKIYSDIAFDGENNTGYLNCTLITSRSDEVSCTASFTLKKDVFDLPMVIIGSFLPIFD
eukprot:NODE_5_length_72347_cov_1.339331.p31 type:complete len:267 gc:universal NODE_5_length_72347_cov_1.339331:12968-13768(+)